MPPSALDHLNAAQRAAVLHGETPLLVLAGAGTGKTSVITHRIAHLVHQKQVWPSQILAVTFTNKAAREMRERVQQLVGSDRGFVNVGTFHRQSGRLLRSHAERVGLNRHFVIYDADDQLQLIKQCMLAANIDQQAVAPRAIRNAIEGWKNNNLSPGEVRVSPSELNLERARQIYVTYQQRLQLANAVDFSDMLRQAVVLLQQAPDVLAACQRAWTHILVDEYQDTNPVQYAWLKLLVTPKHSLTVVGDDDQSIYRWRGADIGNILRFERDFPGASVIRLEENYRSTNRILQAANGVISHNAARKGKTLFSALGDGDKVERELFATEREEAEHVVRAIADRLARTSQAPSIGILYRTNGQSRPLEDALRRRQIPYLIVGGVRFYDRKEVKDACSYLRLLANPASDLDFLRIVNSPARGLGKVSLERLRTGAEARSCPLLQMAQQLGHEPALAKELAITPRAAASLTALGRQLAEHRAEADSGASLAEVLGHTLQSVGYLAALQQGGSEEADERLQNLAELSRALEEYQATSQEPSLAGFLEEVALLADVDALREQGAPVVMMTLHAAKGLEFDHVFLPGLEEGLLPHARSIGDRAAEEEERRLCYVGITRARRTLMLSAARVRSTFGQLQLCELSRFWQELPSEVCAPAKAAPTRQPWLEGEPEEEASDELLGSQAFQDGLGYIGVGRAKATKRKWQQQAAAVPAPDGLAPGRKVLHATFGEGPILAVEGEGQHTKVTVQFAEWGKKVVVARFVTLLADAANVSPP